MTCLYPHNAPVTGYKKGCRCPRCKTGHAGIRLRAVQRKARGELHTEPSARYPVPAALVSRHVNAWLDKQSLEQLAERTGRPNIARKVWRLNHEVATVSFAFADMFISAIDPGLWQTDPELNAILESLPDPPVDDEGDGLLSDGEICQWTIDTRESMTPAAWKQLQRALAWVAPELTEAA